MGAKNSKSTGAPVVKENVYVESKCEDEDDDANEEEVEVTDEQEKETLRSLSEAKQRFTEGNRYFKQSNYDKAKEDYATALGLLYKSSTASKVKEKSIILNNLGLLEFATGRYHEALELHRQALDMRKSLEHETIKTEGLEHIALGLRELASHRTSAETRTLISHIREHDNVDAFIADSLNNLGACYEVTGNLPEARRLYEESLELRKLIFGEKGILTAESMQNLATVLNYQGELAQAEELLMRVYSIYEEKFGNSSPEVAVAMNNTGVLLSHAGKLDAAEEMLKKAYEIRRMHFGEAHHYTVNTKQNLAYVENKREMLRPGHQDATEEGEGDLKVVGGMGAGDKKVSGVKTQHLAGPADVLVTADQGYPFCK